MKKLFYSLFVAIALLVSASAVSAQTTTYPASKICVDPVDGVQLAPDANGGCPSGYNLLAKTNLTYLPLEPLPGVPANGSANFCQLLNGMFRLLIFFGGLLAVGSFVYAGVMYMTSEVVGIKSKAKEGVQASVWGLLLLLASWIILNTINPQLLSCNQALNPVNPYQSVPTQTTQQLTTQQQNAQAATQAIQAQQPLTQTQQTDFQAVRHQEQVDCESSGGVIFQGAQGCSAINLQMNPKTGQNYKCSKTITGLICAK